MKGKKLFCLLIFSVIAGNIYSQIEYYNYSPDTVIIINENWNSDPDSAFFLMDINGDSIDDIEFKIHYKYVYFSPSCNHGFYIKVKSINGKNKFSGSLSGGPCGLTAYSFGAIISDNNNWNPFYLSNYVLFNYCGWPVTCSPFNNDKYLAFTDTINNSCHYGWILLSTDNYGGYYNEPGYVRLTVNEFAYNSDPYNGIIAGDTITSLEPSSICAPMIQDKTLFYPNPTTGKIYIDEIGYKKIEILNVLGEVLIEVKTNEISMEEYSKGIYFIRYYFEGRVITRKIIKN
jgi:hypothetical protein